MSVKASELLTYGADILKKANIPDWDYDSRFLLDWVCQVSRMDLLLDPYVMVEEEKSLQYRQYIEKRACHEPLQYLIGEWEFMGLPFKVNPSVLIPRQDTECLVEWILSRERNNMGEDEFDHAPIKILDVCTGSGCIAISLDCLWKEFCHSEKKVEALDISKEALKTASDNNELNHAQVMFRESNMFDNVKDKYDIIVSNPPYIPTQVVDGLMAEVVQNEPRLALDGKEDGLHFYRILAEKGRDYLKPGGRIYLEIGHDQGESVPKLLKESGFTLIEVRKDLAGHDRCIRAVFPG